MADHHDKVIDQQFRKAERKLPGRFAAWLRWLRRPRGVWIRVPVAASMIAGGVFGFLPLLGFWMVPLGLLLLALDVPLLKPPVARMVLWIENKWRAWWDHRRSS